MVSATTKKFVVYMHKTPSGKVYIGITSNNISRRWQNGYGYKNNKHFFNAILKYGWENIEHKILFDNLSKEDACKKEIALIAQYKSNKIIHGYNQSTGGECAHSGLSPSQETREKIRKALLGRKLSIETRKRLSAVRKGSRLSEKTKRKLSKDRMGERNPMYGKRASDKQKAAIKKALGKPVICVETNIIYPSIKDAERETGITDSGIQAVCKGTRKTAGKRHWAFVGDNVC